MTHLHYPWNIEKILLHKVHYLQLCTCDDISAEIYRFIHLYLGHKPKGVHVGHMYIQV